MPQFVTESFAKDGWFATRKLIIVNAKAAEKISEKIILGNLKKSKKVNKIFADNSKIIIGSMQSAKKSKNVEYLEYKKKNFLEALPKDGLELETNIGLQALFRQETRSLKQLLIIKINLG